MLHPLISKDGRSECDGLRHSSLAFENVTSGNARLQNRQSPIAEIDVDWRTAEMDMPTTGIEMSKEILWQKPHRLSPPEDQAKSSLKQERVISGADVGDQRISRFVMDRMQERNSSH